MDSSALIKRYIAERGSAWLKSLLNPSAANIIVIAYITPADIAKAHADFANHFKNEHIVADFPDATRNEAMTLSEIHALRGYDAVQSASALATNRAYVAAGEMALTLISADAELNAAALAEGLAVEDPNNH